ERGVEVLAQILEPDAILRPARTGDGWLDGPEIQRQQLVEGRAVARLAPEALLLGVAFDEVDALEAAAGQPQVRQRLVVDREQRRRRPELGAHVADRGPVGER